MSHQAWYITEGVTPNLDYRKFHRQGKKIENDILLAAFEKAIDFLEVNYHVLITFSDLVLKLEKILGLDMNITQKQQKER